MEKGKRFVGWRIAKIRGYRFPALSGEISVGGLANLYRSVDTLSAGIMIPLEFGLLKARFPPQLSPDQRTNEPANFPAGLGGSALLQRDRRNPRGASS